ncbi:class I adenylate-forming enzyme family protein [Microbacterium sp. NC79]|uniref:class I adenylate-forming enzyme family protein n=1 Tax=Microbacterium sp. NC79 TaxID=2851009 RepID=UPI001C2BAB60|nr:AMP-binding protein [Microbacterium sp. NC79]MBV0894595.1 AMP-binding protein [Microbacterium sp. NC79]
MFAHTLGRWIADRAATQPDAIAVIDGGVTVTYRDLLARIDALAARLSAGGYGVGDRIATIAGNSTDQIVLFFACARTGMVYVPLSWRLTVAELADLLHRAQPVLVVIDDEHATVATEALRARGSVTPMVGLGTAGIETHVPRRFAGTVEQRDVRDDDALLVIFTSGSESAPKGVVLTHANCFWTNLALASAVQITSDDVVLTILPQFHVAAWNCQPLLALWRGATLVLERSFQPGRALHLIAEHRVTTMMGVPTHYRLLSQDRGFASADLTSVRVALVGGATMPDDLAVAWRERGLALVQGYGLTEAGPNVACARAGDVGLIGRPYAHVDVMLADPLTGGELAGPATGELWVRGPSVSPGYLNDAEATARTMSGDWLRTGDVAERLPDGQLRIIDRVKDIFISGGENVSSAEVERALEKHPQIERAGVVGIPDEVWGERGLAFIVASAPISADEVLAHARTLLAGFKVPVRVEFVAELPTLSIEKLARTQLRDRARAIVGML